ncbi:unnamed protein product, partial [Closterium sp. NIES-64]
MEVQLPRRSRQRDIREMADVTARGRLDYLRAAAVAENDLEFRTSSSKTKAMQAFVDAVAAFGKAYTFPSAYKVAGPLLVKLKLDTEELIKPIKEIIAQNDTAPVIVDCVDSKTAKKTGEYLAKLIQHAICEVGDSHIVQVVMDNAANNKRAANLLKDEYPQVFFTNCAAHVLDLMLHDMGKVKAVKRVLNQVHRVVMMVKGSASAVTLFRELFSKLALVRPGATRFGMQVIMIERFLEVKKALKEMVISEEWKRVVVANTEEGQAIRGLLLEETFWDSVTAILGLMKPIYEVLRIVDRRSLVMGSVYSLMLEATVKTNEAATKAAAQLSKKTGLLSGNEKAAFLAAFKAIIANRWDGQLHNPLHTLGWLLNPKNQYLGEIREDAELRAGAEEVFKARGGSVEMRTMLAVQLAAFHKGEGKLGSVDVRWAATILVESGRLSAAEWWALYEGELYSKLSNGSLQEGSTSVLLSLPVEAEVDEEEEAGGEPCTIDWDTFGNIGKRVTKRKRANLKKKKSASKSSGSRKGKEKVCEEDGSSDDDSGPDEPTKRKNKGGRIDSAGRLACSYHGWAFAGSGACQLIPQAAPEHPGQPPRALASSRACATAFPVKEMHGVLFVWPDEHSADQAEATPLPLPNGVDFNEYTVFPAYSRLLPYGFEFLGENFADPSHFPFSHHGVGTTKREQGGPMKEIAVVEPGAAGFHGPFQMESYDLPSDFAFQAPQLVVYTYYLKQQQPKFSFFKGKAEAAAPPNAFTLCLYMTPSAPGSSIVVSLQMLKRGDGKKMGFPLPPWSVHLRQHQIYDGDAYFLHCQERTLQHQEQQQQGAQGEGSEGDSEQGAGSGRVSGKGSGWRAFYMPTSSDLFVVAFRQWLAKYA